MPVASSMDASRTLVSFTAHWPLPLPLTGSHRLKDSWVVYRDKHLRLYAPCISKAQLTRLLTIHCGDDPRNPRRLPCP